MSAPRWCRVLLGRIAPTDRRAEVLGDLDEAHELRRKRYGPVRATLGTTAETLDMARALTIERIGRAPISILDFKLGLRMLARYPGLSVLGAVAMVFALTVAATGFEMASQLVYPKLPLPDGDRIVGLEVWDVEQAGNDDPRLAHDFLRWQERLTRVEHLGTFRTVGTNLRLDDGNVVLSVIAEMSASGFTVAGIAPALGRTYREDERDGPPVIVLGHRLWTDHFASDPDIIGRTLRIGEETATIVGVMPESFSFPISHQAWVPMRLDLEALGPREGPPISVFGKLAPGHSLVDAQTELTAIGEALALESPSTHENLRPQVLPHATSIFGLSGKLQSMFVVVGFYGYNLTGVLFVVLICGNVALLMYARAVARERELVVRGALGASRLRIVSQLFTEALILSGVAALVSLATVRYATGVIYGLIEHELALESVQMPFWFHNDLTPSTVAYTFLLAVSAAAMAGVLPGLKVTRGIRENLQKLTGSSGRFRFGGIWTAVIVTQIAVTVVIPFITVNLVEEVRQVAQAELPVSLENHITTQLHLSGRELGMPGESELADPQLRAEEFRQRLLRERGVEAVTFTSAVPRMYHRWAQVEVDGPSAEPLRLEAGHRVGTAGIDAEFFETLGVRTLHGRDFGASDLDADITPVIVNETFVDEVLGGRNALGVRIRYVAAEGGRFEDEPGPWMEIVGVVADLGAKSGYGQAGLYQPMRLGEVDPVNVIVRSVPETALMGRLPRIAFDVDPILRVRETLPLEAVRNSELDYYRFGVLGFIVMSVLAILLSTGGIYSIMSFTVSQRTREIGIRTALGCRPTRVVGAILRRPLLQMGAGITGGAMLTGGLAYVLGERYDSPAAIAGIGLYMVGMTLVCMVACVVPARRALRVEPSEALRVEG